jgi:cytochrome b561
MAPRADRAAHYAGHAAMGYDLLAVVVLRLLWRWMNPVPALPSDLKPWEWWSARLGHFGLYVLMFATTVGGWALAGTGRRHYEHDIFGLKIPLFYQSTDRAMHELLEDWHRVLSYALAALVAVHILGALRHHFIKHNDVLRRMIGLGKPAAAADTRMPAE